MPPTRSRAAGLLMAATIALVAGGVAAPVTAAESPEAAVNQLLDAVEGGDYAAIDTLVCETERSAVRAMLDPGEAVGMEAARDLLRFQVQDRAVEVTSQDGTEATVRITGTMSMNVAEGDVESIALALLEADMGELSEEDIDLMLPFMEMALTQSMPMDEELTVIDEDGEWLVCGGLGEAPDETDYGFEASVSNEGICALATPEELSALGPLVYDTSSGFDTFCTYSTTDYDLYHTASLSLEFDQDAEFVASAYGADQELQVGGARAWSPGPDGFNTSLVVQAGPDLLIVSVWPSDDPPEGLDWLTQATAIAELVLPRLAEARADLLGPAPEPTPEPTPEVPLCEEAFLDELNAQTGLGLDTAAIDGTSCSFNPLDVEPGLHFVFAYIGQSTLDDYRNWLPEVEETVVAGRPALVTENQVVLELPDGEQVLDISINLDTSDEGLSVTVAEVAELVAEHILARLTGQPGPA